MARKQRRVIVGFGTFCFGFITALCFLAPPAMADDAKDDPELFLTVIAARKQNLEKLRTWQGKAQVTSYVIWSNPTSLLDPKADLDFDLAIPGEAQRTTTECDFALDMPSDALLLRMNVTHAQQIKAGVTKDAPNLRQAEAKMLHRNGLYELSQIYTRADGRKENGLVIWSADMAKDRMWTWAQYDPRRYLSTWEGSDINVQLTYAHKWSVEGVTAGLRGITREGQLVTYRVELKGTKWCYTYDLAKGGHLVAMETKSDTFHNTYAYEYVEIDGIWIPSVCKRKGVYTSKTSEKNGSISEFRFTESVLNKELPDSAFSLETLGVHKGCRITDRRGDARSYTYDGEAIDRMAAETKEALTPPAATQPAATQPAGK